MGGWVTSGVFAGAVVFTTAGVRLSLQVVVVLWSLRADAAGRDHALAFLRLLRLPSIRDRSP